MIEEFTEEERAEEHRKLQAFINSYLKYPRSVMEDFPIKLSASQAIEPNDSWQLW